MKRYLVIITLLLLALTACKKEPVIDEKAEARDGLYELMNYIYFWREYLPLVDVNDYEGPEELLEALRYTPKDRWSYVSDYDSFMSSMQGAFVGHGISIGLDADSIVRVVYIHNKSDMWPLGVRRGWIVEKINNVAVAPIFKSGNLTQYYTLMGESMAGVVNKFEFQKPDGTKVTINSTKASFTINSVLADTVYDISGSKIAYLNLNSFKDPAVEELKTAFASFYTQGAQDLIIDLRYNGGGYMEIAQELASLCLNNTYTNKICYRTKHNKYIKSEWDDSTKFAAFSNSLSLDRVVFITNRGSASASEVVINSLKSYIDVFLVGDTTHGKPCGMYAFGYPFEPEVEGDYSWVFLPIAFEYTNADNEGGFYEGMVPDVLVADDIKHDFVDTNEACLSAAIALLTGTKSATPVSYHKPGLYAGEVREPSILLRKEFKDFRK